MPAIEDGGSAPEYGSLIPDGLVGALPFIQSIADDALGGIAVAGLN